MWQAQAGNIHFTHGSGRASESGGVGRVAGSVRQDVAGGRKQSQEHQQKARPVAC